MTNELPSSKIFYDVFVAATAYFKRHVEAINNLNVFPVPDGDTGTNMYQTLRGIRKRVKYADSYSVQDLAKLMCDAALWEGRGNSGIILSQIFKGIYLGLKDKNLSDPDTLSSSLTAAYDSAYNAISNPTEGTILTLLRDVAKESERQSNKELTFRDILGYLLIRAKESVDSTPDYLELLKDAGVVDAGAYGLEVFLQGIHIHLSGLDVETADVKLRIPEKGGEGVQNLIKDHQVTGEDYGYCTQFVVETDLQNDAVRRIFVDLGFSLVVAGDNGVFRIHIHTRTPGNAINAATNIGSISAVSVEDMESQSEEIVDFELREMKEREDQKLTGISSQTGLVVVASGIGLEQIFRENGAAAIISGGDSMNPSVADIVGVLDSIECESLLLLPNNKNIVSTAEQAANLSKTSVVVIPTTTIAEGLECSVEFDRDATVEVNQKTLLEVMSNVKTLLLFKAQRTVQIGEIQFESGKYGAILDESPLSLKGTAPQILLEALKFSGADNCDQITILLGEHVSDLERLDVERILSDQFADFYHESIQIIEGKQPNYEYIVSILFS